MEIPGGVGLGQAPPTMYKGNSGGGGGSKVNVPSMGVWIFSGTTQ